MREGMTASGEIQMSRRYLRDASTPPNTPSEAVRQQRHLFIPQDHGSGVPLRSTDGASNKTITRCMGKSSTIRALDAHLANGRAGHDVSHTRVFASPCRRLLALPAPRSPRQLRTILEPHAPRRSAAATTYGTMLSWLRSRRRAFGLTTVLVLYPGYMTNGCHLRLWLHRRLASGRLAVPLQNHGVVAESTRSRPDRAHVSSDRRIVLARFGVIALAVARRLLRSRSWCRSCRSRRRPSSCSR